MKPPQNFIRLGYSSISATQIEPGIKKLAQLIHDSDLNDSLLSPLFDVIPTHYVSVILS